MAIAPALDLDEVHGGSFEVLLDRIGLMVNHVFPRGLDEPIRRGVVHRTLVRFWYDRVKLDSALARGNLWTAHHYLERCRERCLDLAWMDALPEVWPGGHEKAETVLDATTLDALKRTVVPLERNALEGGGAGSDRLLPRAGPRSRGLERTSLPDRAGRGRRGAFAGMERT